MPQAQVVCRRQVAGHLVIDQQRVEEMAWRIVVHGHKGDSGAPCGRLAWFEQGADPKQPWKRHDISRRAQGMYDMFFVCDLNGDGAMDFIATRGNSSPHDGTIWLEQVRTDKPVPVFTSAWPPEEDSRQQPIPRDQ